MHQCRIIGSTSLYSSRTDWSLANYGPLVTSLDQDNNVL